VHAAAEYRQDAQEYIDLARCTTSDAMRMQFLELAHLWLTAAAQVEHLKGGGSTISGFDQRTRT